MALDRKSGEENTAKARATSRVRGNGLRALESGGLRLTDSMKIPDRQRLQTKYRSPV